MKSDLIDMHTCAFQSSIRQTKIFLLEYLKAIVIYFDGINRNWGKIVNFHEYLTVWNSLLNEK